MDALHLTRKEVRSLMTHRFKLSRRIARLRVPAVAAIILAFTACDTTNSLNPESSTPPESGTPAPDAPSFATSFAGGIPMGLFRTPYTSIGTRYNGTLRNIYPNNVISELRAIRDRGGKVMLNLAGAPPRYTDKYGNFSLAKWKTSVDRYKGINFSSFISDGTLIGNFLIDEPNDPNNWKNHKPVSPATLEEMAKYSKMRWSTLTTVVRVRPDYLGSNHHYLDAAWSQYHSRFGSPSNFVSHDVSIAKNKGLGLIVGMNVLKGNNGSKMTASQVKSWGGALLSSSYPCAFLSWAYDDKYLSTSSMKDAMTYLRHKAQSRSMKSCRG
jgi:hypothetical protein